MSKWPILCTLYAIIPLQVNADDVLNDPTLQSIRKERGYSYEDTLCLTANLPDYEKKVRTAN